MKILYAAAAAALLSFATPTPISAQSGVVRWLPQTQPSSVGPLMLGVARSDLSWKTLVATYDGRSDAMRVLAAAPRGRQFSMVGEASVLLIEYHPQPDQPSFAFLCSLARGTCAETAPPPDYATDYIPLGDDRVLSLSPAGAMVYEQATGSWHAVPRRPRGTYGTPVRLANGDVLVSGGVSGLDDFMGDAVAVSHLFSAATETWIATGSLDEARVGHTATLLPDGDVVVIGGHQRSVDAQAVERLDLESSEWEVVLAAWPGRTGHSATLLSDGTILVLGGGLEIDGYPRTFESVVIGPATASWRSVPIAVGQHSGHAAYLLSEQEIVLLGGNCPLARGQEYCPPERYSLALVE